MGGSGASVDLWTPDRGVLPEKALHATLKVFAKREESGVMRLRAAATTTISLHYIEGLIVGADSVADDWLLARRLVASGVASPQVFAQAPSEGVPLHEFLGSQDLVPAETLSEYLVDRFRDNLFQTFLCSWTSVDFRRTEGEMPANMQFGQEPMELLTEGERWCAAIRPMLQFLPAADPMVIDPENSSAEGEAQLVASFLDQPMSRGEVLALSPLERYRTLWWLAWLLNRGIVRPASWHTSTDSGVGRSSMQGC